MASQAIIDDLRSFVIFFFIFGLTPIWKNRRCNFVTVGYSLISMALVCFILYLAIFLNNVIEDSALLYAVAYSFLLSISVTHIILLLEAFFKRNAHLEIFNHFDTVDHIFQKKLRRYIPRNSEKRSIWIRFLSLISIFLVIKTFLIIHLHSQNLLTNFWLHCFFSIFMLRLASLQILLYVRLLRNRLKITNEILVEIVIDNSIKNTNLIHISSPEYVIENSTVFVISNMRNNNVIFCKMLYLKKVYGQLYEISIQINKVFGWSLLCLTTQSFIDFTSSIYWTFLALDQNIPDTHKAIDKICFLVPIVIIMTLMANDCSSCTRLVGDWFFHLFITYKFCFN